MTLALILFLFPLAYSPGPGNMIFAANGARFGLRATLPATAGYHLATWGVTAAIGLGLGGAIAAVPALTGAMRIVGASYVLWLALRMAMAGHVTQGPVARVLGFWGGVVLLVFNPKAYVIIALMYSQFLQAGDWRTVLWISTVFTLNNALAFAIWAAMGDRLARHLRDPARARVMNRSLAVLLAGVAVWMVLR